MAHLVRLVFDALLRLRIERTFKLKLIVSPVIIKMLLIKAHHAFVIVGLAFKATTIWATGLIGIRPAVVEIRVSLVKSFILLWWSWDGGLGFQIIFAWVGILF
jgi:hypothetical protein